MKLRVAGTILATLLLMAGQLRALTWTGSGSSGSIFDAGNWGGTPFTSGAGLDFGGTGRTDPNVPFSDTVSNINFTNLSQAYVFSGSASQVLTLTGWIGVNNGSAPITFSSSLDLALGSGAHEFYVTGASTTLTVAGAISGVGGIDKWDNGTLFLTGANTYSGGTTVKNGSLTVNTGSITHSAADMVVGYTAAETGALNLFSGADLTNYAGQIGYASNSTGNVMVSGAGSTWTNTNSLNVGLNGTGTLSIAAGGAVSANAASVGELGGAAGTVTITGTGSSLTSINNFVIGNSGSGSATILSGGSATGYNVVLGNNASGDGDMAVTGTNSSLTATSSLIVGSTGSGSMLVNNGGTVTTSLTTVGENANGVGDLIIDGGTSSLTASSMLGVGWSGNGTMKITGGADVTAYSAILGQYTGGTGALNVTGASSTLTVTDTNLYVGNGANGILYLNAAGQVNVGGGTGTLMLAHSSGGAGILKIGNDGSTNFAGGILNAATITTGSGNSGEVKFYTTATAASPYYLTRDGTAGGTAVTISGPTQVHQVNGYTVLTGSNTYSGATTIAGGTLVAGNTAAFGSSTVTISNGAKLVVASGVGFGNVLNFGAGGGKLGGGGTFLNPLTLGSGGVTLAPGLSPGVLNFGAALTANDGLGAEIEIRAPTGTPGTDWDLINVTGTFDLTPLTTNGFSLKVISLMLNDSPGAVSGLSGPASWTIVTATNISGFNASDFDIDSTQFVGGGIFTLTKSSNDLILHFTPVPEPSTYALLALGSAGSGFAAWRRKRRSN